MIIIGADITSKQPCWYCQNFSSCLWGTDLTPVTGWIADPVYPTGQVLETWTHGEEPYSYAIKSCPEYVPDHDLVNRKKNYKERIIRKDGMIDLYDAKTCNLIATYDNIYQAYGKHLRQWTISYLEVA